MSTYNRVFVEYLFHKAASKESMEPARIRQIRKHFKLTQLAFSDFIMINYETYRSWEMGRRQPSSPGYAILSIAEKYPEVFIEHRKKIIDEINLNAKIH